MAFFNYYLWFLSLLLLKIVTTSRFKGAEPPNKIDWARLAWKISWRSDAAVRTAYEHWSNLEPQSFWPHLSIQGASFLLDYDEAQQVKDSSIKSIPRGRGIVPKLTIQDYYLMSPLICATFAACSDWIAKSMILPHECKKLTSNL